MLKKRYFSCLFAYCVLAVLQGQSCLCSQQDEHRVQDWYKVTAPSGLVLRKGPDQKESKHYIVSVEGNVIPNKNINTGALVNGYNAPIYSIENYKINLYEQTENFSPNRSKTPWKHQKIVDGRVTAPNDSDSINMDVYYIYFAGDLDGDNELDLILARFGGVGVGFRLYLSSKKLPGFILRYMAECSDSSC